MSTLSIDRMSNLRKWGFRGKSFDLEELVAFVGSVKMTTGNVVPCYRVEKIGDINLVTHTSDDSLLDAVYSLCEAIHGGKEADGR